MLASTKEMRSYDIQATDGRIGGVEDFYFDDQDWVVRYLVVDTGHWLPGRLVLIAPEKIGEPDHPAERLPVHLTRERIENSPSIQKHLPVSRQAELDLAKYYGWAAYWDVGTLEPQVSRSVAAEGTAHEKERMEDIRQSSLRSCREVTNYHIHADDGEIGHVEDFIVQTDDWGIRYLVVDTRNWWPGKKVLIVPTWITRVAWSERLVYVRLSREDIKNGPEYDPRTPISEQYEQAFREHHGESRET